jgi:hypothetical protein
MTDREVRDMAEIRRVLERYCRAIDRCDEDLVRSVYHPDAVDDHGTFKGSGWDFAKWVVVQLRAFEATMHTLGQSMIEVQGDRATSETYCIAYHQRRGADGNSLLTFGGRYVDELERRDGEWRLSKRVVVHDWNKVERIEHTFPDAMIETFVQGRRSRDDPSYRT